MAKTAYDGTGVAAACVTPFKDDESLDLERLGSHIEFMLDGGIQGIMIAGGCGEYANLSADERKTVISEAVKVVDGRVPVIVGALGASTREVLEVGEHAVKVGADALLVLPPYYIKPSFDGVVKHFEIVAKEIALPIVAYNNPGRTGWPLGIEHLVALTDIPGVVAVKECERDMANICLKITALGDKSVLMSGDDDLGMMTYLAGGRGAIFASANLCPKLCMEMVEAAIAHDIPKAMAAHNKLLAIFAAWMLPNHPGPLKQAMAMVGRSVGPARAPLALMTDAQQANLQAILDASGEVA
jgi:4-hydroxy-tetrahydrodipicolinate synthase